LNTAPQKEQKDAKGTKAISSYHSCITFGEGFAVSGNLAFEYSTTKGTKGGKRDKSNFLISFVHLLQSGV
jgi:hypothetical protein